MKLGKETQPNPNKRYSRVKQLALGTAALTLATGAVFAVQKDGRDGSPKGNVPVATADTSPTQETGMPPVPSSPEISAESLNQHAQAGAESLAQLVIEHALQANNSTTVSEMYENREGLLNLNIKSDAESSYEGKSGIYNMELVAEKSDKNEMGMNPDSVRSVTIWSGVTTAEANSYDPVFGLTLTKEATGNWVLSTYESDPTQAGSLAEASYNTGNQEASMSADFIDAQVARAAMVATSAINHGPVGPAPAAA